MKQSRTLRGSQVEAFCPPLLTGETPASMTFPDSKGQIWTIANQESSNHGTTQDKMKGMQTLLTPWPCRRPRLWATVIKPFVRSSGVVTHRQKPGVHPFVLQIKLSSASPKTLSPGFDLALVCRQAKLLVILVLYFCKKSGHWKRDCYKCKHFRVLQPSNQAFWTPPSSQ